jgi:hypothetical protein
VAVALTAVLLVVGLAIVLRLRSDDVHVGDTARVVAVVEGTCLRASFTLHGRLWVSVGSELTPETWGVGDELGSFLRTGKDEGVFTSEQTGEQVRMWGGKFHSLACAIRS